MNYTILKAYYNVATSIRTSRYLVYQREFNTRKLIASDNQQPKLDLLSYHELHSFLNLNVQARNLRRVILKHPKESGHRTNIPIATLLTRAGHELSEFGFNSLLQNDNRDIPFDV